MNTDISVNITIIKLLFRNKPKPVVIDKSGGILTFVDFKLWLVS